MTGVHVLVAGAGLRSREAIKRRSGRSLLFVGVIVLMTMTVSCGTDDPDSSQSAPYEAKLRSVDPEVADRIEGALAAARAEPDSAERRVDLGMAYEVGGLPEAARRCYEQAVLLDPDEPRWSYFLALVRGRFGDLDGALEAIDTVLTLDGNYLPAHLNRGAWLLDSGRTGEARATYQRATVLDGDSNAAWVGLGRSYFKEGKYERAAVILETVSKKHPHPYVFQLLGQTYRAAGDIESARRVLAKGKPGPPPAWPDPWSSRKDQWLAGFGTGLKQAARLMGSGRTGEAIDLLEQLRVDHPDDVALLNNLSVAYAQSGREDKAFEVLSDGLVRHPDYYPFHLNIATPLYRRGEIEQALGHLDEALVLNPTLGWAHQQRGIYLMKLARDAEALEAFNSSLAYDAASPRYFVLAAQLERQFGDLPRAIQRLEQALEVDPSMDDVRQRLEQFRQEAK